MSNKRAFTLVELLVVVGIMGLLGTASVGGYRQMQRGMAERGALDNASKFIELASQRAQIDRQPVAIIFSNELLRSDEDDDLQTKIVVGKAVAIRCCGRISGQDGNRFLDEFGDLEMFGDGGDYLEESEAAKIEDTLYLVDLAEGKAKKASVVYTTTDDQEEYLTANPVGDGNDRSLPGRGKIVRFGFRVKNGEGGWKVGSVYGREFQTLTLPHGYVFGSSGDVPNSMANPVKELQTQIFFDAESRNKGSIRSTARVTVSSLRPGSGGALSVQQIGLTAVPDAEVRQ